MFVAKDFHIWSKQKKMYLETLTFGLEIFYARTLLTIITSFLQFRCKKAKTDKENEKCNERQER